MCFKELHNDKQDFKILNQYSFIIITITYHAIFILFAIGHKISFLKMLWLKKNK